MDGFGVVLLLCLIVGVPILAIVGLVTTVKALCRSLRGAAPDAPPEEQDPMRLLREVDSEVAQPVPRMRPGLDRRVGRQDGICPPIAAIA